MVNKKYYTWEEINRDLEKLTEQIQKKYDIIIGIARGGLYPTYYLSKKLNIVDVDIISAYSYIDTIRTETNIIKKDFSNIRNKKILLVDDLTDSGSTILDITKFLQNFSNFIYTAVLYTKTKSKFIPNYCCEMKDSNEWIVFPWEV